jgi:hypothetical protein
MKKLLLLWAFLLLPSMVHAQTDEPCFAWISKRDTTIINSSTYQRVVFSVQNNGIEDYDRVRVNSSTFAQVDTICPVLFTKNVSSPYDYNCQADDRVLAPNEFVKITEAYEGNSYYSGSVSTPYYGTSYVGDPYDYWTNGVNLGADDAEYSDINLVYPWDQWHNHETTSNYALSGIPNNAVITGIDVQIKGYATGDYTAHNIGVYLSRDLMATYQVNSVSNDLLWLNVPSTPTIHTFSTNSNSSQFNSYNWQASDLNNNPNFSISLYADENNTHHFYVDYIKVRVNYSVSQAGRFDVGISNGSDTKWCAVSSLGTLYPDYSYGNGGSSSAVINIGGLAVPVSCPPYDIICDFKSWLYNLFITIFGFNLENFNDQLNDLLLATRDKIPNYYLYRFRDEITVPTNFETDQNIPDFNFSFTPKLKKNGEWQDLNPVEIHVASATFSPVAPFIGYYKRFFMMMMYIGFGYYVVKLARRIYTGGI